MKEHTDFLFSAKVHSKFYVDNKSFPLQNENEKKKKKWENVFQVQNRNFLLPFWRWEERQENEEEEW